MGVGVAESGFLEALGDGGLIFGRKHECHGDRDWLGERDPAQVRWQPHRGRATYDRNGCSFGDRPVAEVEGDVAFHDQGLQTAAGEKLMDEVVVSGIGRTRVQHNRMLGNTAQVDLVQSGERMVRGEQDTLLVAPDRPEPYPVSCCRCAAHTDVHAAGLYCL